jgi:hypothetical protein
MVVFHVVQEGAIEKGAEGEQGILVLEVPSESRRVNRCVLKIVSSRTHVIRQFTFTLTQARTRISDSRASIE